MFSVSRDCLLLLSTCNLISNKRRGGGCRRSRVYLEMKLIKGYILKDGVFISNVMQKNICKINSFPFLNTVAPKKKQQNYRYYILLAFWIHNFNMGHSRTGRHYVPIKVVIIHAQNTKTFLCKLL